MVLTDPNLQLQVTNKSNLLFTCETHFQFAVHVSILLFCIPPTSCCAAQ